MAPGVDTYIVEENLDGWELCCFGRHFKGVVDSVSSCCASASLGFCFEWSVGSYKSEVGYIFASVCRDFFVGDEGHGFHAAGGVGDEALGEASKL